MRTWKAALGLALLLALPAHAGVIGPKRPSDLVNVIALSGLSGMTCSGLALAFDTRVTADGDRVPFAIPPGQVFVVTGLEWDTYGGSATKQVIASVVMNKPAVCDNTFAGSSAVPDATGGAAGNITFPTGIAIRPGIELGLFALNGIPYRGKLTGYFTADK
jgi:hypothetical protein